MPKTDNAESQIVVVQAICTYWGKSARGGPEAVLRNRVPEAAKLQEVKQETKAVPAPMLYAVQHIHYGNSNKFSEPTRSTAVLSASPPTQLKGIFLDYKENTLAVAYQYDRTQGAPERHSQRIEALNLSPGQWGRIRYNGRHSDWEAHWWYEKWVWNVGLFGVASPSVFLATKPIKVASYMALLK